MKNTSNKEIIFLIAFFSGAGIIILGVILGIVLFGSKPTTYPTTTSTVVVPATSESVIIEGADDIEESSFLVPTPPNEDTQEITEIYPTTKKPKTTQANNGSISINSTLQYNLNIFLSNFSEVDLDSFSSRPSNSELVHFGLNHHHNNKYMETIEFSEDGFEVNGDFCYERLEYTEVVKTVKKYFNITLSKSDFSDYHLYKDGYVFCDCTGGFQSYGFTVVNKIEKCGNNLYKVYYDIYDDFNDFDDSMYGNTPSDMTHLNRRYFGSGTATISASNLNDRSTYTLKSYSPSRIVNFR